MQPALCVLVSGQFLHSICQAKEMRGGHAGIHNHQTPFTKRGDKKRDWTSVSLSLFSTNHSNSLFMLDLYSTPPPPVSSIKHSFISLHPFVQFGHIILCSGMSSFVIYELSEWIHLIYSVCWYMEIQTGGGATTHNVIKKTLAAPFCFWTTAMMGWIRKKHICSIHKWTKEHMVSLLNETGP